MWSVEEGNSTTEADEASHTHLTQDSILCKRR